jgi:formylglycine-generating enzyme required for sulfatase activity
MRRAVPALLIAALAALPAAAQDTGYAPRSQLIPPPACLGQSGGPPPGPAPCAATSHEEWLRDISHWRTERRIRVGFDGARYGEGALAWTQSAFIQPQLMVHDRALYDVAAGHYTVDRYLDDLERRYGGIDSVLVWPTYPNMGVDDRNQLDLIESMPGGLEGVRGMIADFHRRGVRVLFPMMMWDQGTHDPGRPWPQAIAERMREIGADGINGDTQDGVPLAFVRAAEASGHPLAFEPEGGPSDEALAWNLLTWGQYGGQFDFVPGVDRFRWLEPRHQVHISDRWARDKQHDLQYAFFNGEGWESWENIWGIWNGITPRDGEATRRIATIERAVAPYLASEGWEPLFPMLRFGVFASRWPRPEAEVYTIVNRNEYDVDGRQMRVPHREGARYLDLYHGAELTPSREGESDVLSFAIEAHGFGAVATFAGAPPAALESLAARMREMTRRPLASYSAAWSSPAQRLVPIAPTAPAASAPPGMVRIPAGELLFRVAGLEIEGSNDIGVDVQYPWETAPRRFHEQRMHVNAFYMDVTPVTNAQFKRFLDASGYRPAHAAHFLRDWHDGRFPEGWDDRPVTWVSIEDARAYAAWAGKRLPHEWEWQYAAEGPQGLPYPWGASWQAERVPVPERGRTLRGPDAVHAHPDGASAFGIEDLVGNVWQWTEEFVDEHTRAAIVRGGSYYQPQGSIWYFPAAYRNDQHGKLLLMAPEYDRAATIGFRCVVDAR